MFCGDVGLASIADEEDELDLVLATGVLHHLDDGLAARLFDLARRVLRPTGRRVTYDGGYVPQLSRVTRWLLARDRGKFVRRREDCLKLASKHFAEVDSYLQNDLLRVP